MNNLIIVGNGFDLSHKLKTSYTDFINHIIDTHLNDRNEYKSLIEVHNSIQSKQDIFKDLQKTLLLESDFVKFKNKFFGTLCRKFSLDNWCDIEKMYFRHLTSPTRYTSSVEDYHNDFEEIKIYLSKYLKQQNINSSILPSYYFMFEKLITYNSAVLNFNYTSTLEEYNIPPEKIIDIHGKLNNTKNPIIFGYAANNDESRKLIERDDKEYMRYIKKHCYKRTNNEIRLREYLDKNSNINVFILGHSCGISDKLILNDILNHDHINSIRVFFYEDYESYFNTQVNIDRIMNNDNNFKKLVSFESSVRTPQLNDNVEQETELIEYINNFVEQNTVKTNMQ